MNQREIDRYSRLLVLRDELHEMLEGDEPDYLQSEILSNLNKEIARRKLLIDAGGV